VISFPSVTKKSIRFHYDLSTLFYRLFWGRHIHHGLWEGNESSSVAQQRLTETLAALAGAQAGQVILDVGCGMGGSTMHLARQGCQVTGVTLSPVQRRWAAAESWCRGLSRRTRWICADAEVFETPDQTYDVVWSVECTEHLFDKPAFFQRAAKWLKPGGTMAICAWLAGDRTDAAAVKKVEDVCEGFLCPSLGTDADYCRWFTDAGLTIEQNLDWTSRVQQTWAICDRRVRRSGVRHLARLIDRDTVRFLDRFRTILEAYQDGSMKYGCFIARKPH
jgi:tocopherol O-methyltransferase